MITPEQVVAQVREWCGVRFLHQGRARTGADCIGFIASALAELGIMVGLENLPTSYARAPQALLIDTLTRVATPCGLQPGALLLIKLPMTEHPSHAAIYTGASIIHSDGMRGKVVEHAYDRPWTTRTDSVWAIPGVTY